LALNQIPALFWVCLIQATGYCQDSQRSWINCTEQGWRSSRMGKRITWRNRILQCKWWSNARVLSRGQST
jgi:hypothetical protein